MALLANKLAGHLLVESRFHRAQIICCFFFKIHSPLHLQKRRILRHIVELVDALFAYQNKNKLHIHLWCRPRIY